MDIILICLGSISAVDEVNFRLSPGQASRSQRLKKDKNSFFSAGGRVDIIIFGMRHADTKCYPLNTSKIYPNCRKKNAFSGETVRVTAMTKKSKVVQHRELLEDMSVSLYL